MRNHKSYDESMREHGCVPINELSVGEVGWTTSWNNERVPYVHRRPRGTVDTPYIRTKSGCRRATSIEVAQSKRETRALLGEVREELAAVTPAQEPSAPRVIVVERDASPRTQSTMSKDKRRLIKDYGGRMPVDSCEKPCRRWFWPFMAGLLTAISGAAGVVTLWQYL